ncbi:hypothetical protein E5163_02575 [Marinicauda algicola]|uniref:Uncharacterized protein n=1 Tax=Marinicauda algicola TaxID=2029849 RepID=A0A4S2H3A4_9PROT|nr:hypothetical protein [Marinicauda algicola]TGY90034.1 hypothetical protein E5163_02575 [Marinicauda algicola]
MMRFVLLLLAIPVGALVRLETSFQGLRVGDFAARSLRVEIRIPFGAEGSGGGRGSAFVGPAGDRFGSAWDSVLTGFEQAVLAQDACTAGAH